MQQIARFRSQMKVKLPQSIEINRFAVVKQIQDQMFPLLVKLIASFLINAWRKIFHPKKIFIN